MTTLVAGASGATGRQVVRQLLERGRRVRAIVRSADRLPEAIRSHPDVSVIEATLLELSDAELARHVAGCDSVVSCLGHNLTWKGMYGPPRRLVTDATRRLCQAIRACHPRPAVKFLLMNTAGNRNRDLDEPIGWAQRLVLALLRRLLPPHADNEQAADFLRTQVGLDDPEIEWVAVRPDNLVDREEVSEYEVHASPTRSAIFDAGSTSRIQVAHFMATLIADPEAWSRWRGRMPVLYDATS